MMSEHHLKVVKPHPRQVTLWKSPARGYRLDGFEGPASRMAGMDSRDLGMHYGAILGVVIAGYPGADPGADPIMEWTEPESLLEEFKAGPKDYFLRVRGYSMMEAGILEGDLVQVRQLRPGTWPPDGAIVLAEVDLLQAIGESSGRTTIKRFFRQGAGIRLQPANSSMESQYYEPDDILIIGMIVSAIHQSFFPS
jgi:phage repressor protein C with HTH and peptisase S24 domain